MSRKRKYSDEFRLKIVKEYLGGKTGGVNLLSAKYGVHHSAIEHWIHLYEMGGIEALFTTSGSYSGEFKVYVIEYMHQHYLSSTQTAAYFHIPSPSTVLQWERIYYEEGKEGLLKERRGRSSKVSGTNKGRPSKKDVNENEDLLSEVQRLRMENEYLKKLIALTQEREKEEQKTK